MKKIVSIFLLTLFAAVTIQAQNHSFKQFFNQFSQHPEATQVTISRPMMWIAKHFVDEDEDDTAEMEMLNSIQSFRLVTIPGERAALKSNTRSVQKFLRNKMEPLMEIRDGKDRITLAIQEKRGIIKEIGLLIDSEDEMVLIQLKGKFDMEQMKHIGKTIGDHTGQVRLKEKDLEVNAQISLYPNPASNENIQVEYPKNLVHSEYVISNLEGKIIQNGSLEQSAFAIDAHNFASGIYIFKIVAGENKQYSKKFTIQ